MRIRRALVLFLGIMLLISGLTACHRNTVSDDESIYISSSWIGGQPQRVDTGIIYYDPGRNGLSFFDYETFQSVSICSKPNCFHDPFNENCGAYEMPRDSVIYNNQIYYTKFTSEIDSDGNPIRSISINASERDGTNRKQVTEVNDIDGAFFYMRLGEKLYYVMFEHEYIKDEISGMVEDKGARRAYLYSFDTENNTLNRIALLNEGNSISASPMGYSDGYIYYYKNEIVDDVVISSFEDAKANTKWHLKRVNIESGKVSSWEHEPSCVDGVLFIDGDYAYVIHRTDGELAGCLKRMNLNTGVETMILDKPTSGAYIVDNKLFITTEEDPSTGGVLTEGGYLVTNKDVYCYNLATEEIAQISIDDSVLSVKVRDVYKDYYIVTVIEGDSMKEEKTYRTAKIKNENFLNGIMDFETTYDGVF